MSTIDDTLAERGARYGDFEGHAYLTQCIKRAMREADGWDDLDNDMVECLEMVAHKIGRIINGDPEYVDSWTDIIGYVRLVEKRLIDDHAALAETVKKVEAQEKDIDARLREAVKVHNKALAEKLGGNADIVKASLNVAAKQQEHKLVSDALKTLEKAGIIKEVRTHHDRFHVIFVGEESGEI